MKRKPLSEVASVLISNVDKKTKIGEEQVRLCNFTDVYYNWAITSSQYDGLMVASANKNAIEKFSLKKGDVAITKDSETRDDIGVSTYIADNMDSHVLGYHCALIRPDEKYLLGKYLNVVLHSSYAMRYFDANASGSGQRYTLTDGVIKEMPIPLPDIETQKKIGELATYIDKKIENNNLICTELEKAIKTVFEHWFFQYDFPNKEGKPYRASGGKLVWNKELKREIPENWTCKNIGELIEISSERIKSDEIGDRLYIPIEVIPRNKLSFYKTADIKKASTGLCVFDEKSILLSNRRVYFHKVSISPFRGVTRDTVFIINPKEKNNLGYIYEILNTNHFIDYATLNSYGTEQPVLSPNTVLDYKIAFPDKSLEKEYSNKVENMIDKILLIQKENRELEKLREYLFPLLVTEQVKIQLSDNKTQI